MKLSNIALVLTAGLLAFTVYLSLQSRNATEDRFDELAQSIEDSKKAVEAEREASAAAAERFAAENERLRLENEKRAKEFAEEQERAKMEMAALKLEAEVVAAGVASAPEKPAVELTPDQQKIKEAASIAEVTDFRSEYGFVVLNRGTNSGLVPGMNFAIRRDHFIVGRIKLDSVEEDESIGNVVTSSIPIGLTIRKGDAIIMGEDAGIF